MLTLIRWGHMPWYITCGWGYDSVGKDRPWPPRLMRCLNHMTFTASGDKQARGTVVSEAAEM